MNEARPPEDETGAAQRDIGQVARDLDAWMADQQYRSWDPYDGLTAPLCTGLLRLPTLARMWLQLVKRSPWNPRPLLGIRKRLYTKTVSDLLAASCIDLHAPADAEARIRDWADALVARRLPAGPGACWGMDLPYVSRFTVATPETPNLFQTVNAMLALLDACERTGEATYADVAAQVVPFLEDGLGRLVDGADHVLWRYYPGEDAVVYNVNALIAMALMRLSTHTGEAAVERTARATMRAVVEAQNDDGSWWYAADARGHWIDGFHSGYVLESLLVYLQHADDPDAARALQRGMEFFRERLLDADGLPRYRDRTRYPIDVQNCAQGVQLMARWTLFDGLHHWPAARRVFEATCRELLILEGNGAARRARFRLQRGRWFSNDLTAIRWGLAPMLLALRWLQCAEVQVKAASVVPDEVGDA